MALKKGASLLFDIDGTLADTDRLHLIAFQAAFKPFGVTIDQQRYTGDIQGFTNEEIIRRIIPKVPAAEAVEVLLAKEVHFRKLAAEDIEPMPGLMALIGRAEAAGIPMAAVTNAPRENAMLILESLGLVNRFQTIVIGGEMAHGKPHPLPYLEGLRRIGGDAAASLAFEDSRTGVQSATAAGIATIGILSSLAEADLKAVGAVAAAIDYAGPAVAEWMLARLGVA